MGGNKLTNKWGGGGNCDKLLGTFNKETESYCYTVKTIQAFHFVCLIQIKWNSKLYLNQRKKEQKLMWPLIETYKSFKIFTTWL